MPHQVADQARIVADRLGALAIAYPCRLADRGVVAHVVDHPDKAVIEHRDGAVEMLLDPFCADSAGFSPVIAQIVDLGLPFGRQCHMSGPYYL